MPKKAYLAAHPSSEQMKDRYKASQDSVATRRWHWLGKISWGWTIKNAAVAVGWDYQYSFKILKSSNELGEEGVKISRKRGFFVTWYGSIRGQKSAKSLSGKRLNWLARSRLKTIGKNRSNVFLYKGFTPYNSRPLHNTNRRTQIIKSFNELGKEGVKISRKRVRNIREEKNLYWRKNNSKK